MGKGLFGLAVAALGLLTQPAAACSTVEGYRTPTNFEMVRQSTLIVLGRITGGAEEATGPEALVDFEPIKVFKGELPEGALHLLGGLELNGQAMPSLPTTLAQSHFSSGMGACVRLLYPKGGLVLAMFTPTPEEMADQYPDTMSEMFQPFARIAEDVTGEEDVWAQAVATYVEAQKGLDDAGLVDGAAKLRDRLLAGPATVATRAMADDLDYYVRTMRSGGEEVEARRPFWTMMALPQESFAQLVEPSERRVTVLRCIAGSSAVELIMPERPDREDLALQIGRERFDAVPFDFDWRQMPKGTAGRIALDDRLRGALANMTEPASFLSSGGETAAAAPLDALQKLEIQCSRLAGEAPVTAKSS